MINRIKKYDWKNFNILLVGTAVILCCISAFTLRMAGGPGMMKSQLIGMLMGLVIIAVLSVMDYHFICQFSAVYYLFGLGLTAATHTPLGTAGSTDSVRWIQLGPVTFQPSELMKIIFIITLASFYVQMEKNLDRWSTLLIAAVLTVIPMLLIMSQPDLSSSLVILFVMVIMVFVAGTSYKIIAPIVAVGMPLSLALFWYIQQPNNLILRGYQFRRIYAWRHPDLDASKDLNMQQDHSIAAIAEGGLYGKFIKDGGVHEASRAYERVPVNESDFIWSVIGEEFGFLGCCLILLLLAIIIIQCFRIARKSKDFLGMMIATGVGSLFLFQVFSNICVATRLFPNTGLPLPFLSNGLSSMMSSMIAIGLVLNVGIQPAKSSGGGFTMRTAYSDDTDKDLDLDL